MIGVVARLAATLALLPLAKAKVPASCAAARAPTFSAIIRCV
jgi:hypothetical protein